MLFLFQDTTQVITQAYSLKEYGVLGVFSIMMIAVIYGLGRFLLAMHKRNEARIEELEKQMLQYMAEDRKTLLEAVNECRNEISNSNSIKEKILQFITAK